VKVGVHAPLPPARTGVSDYAAALIEVLREHGEVAVNSETPSHVELYHLGNNQLHRPIYLRALEHPGIVVLHDALLGHFFLGCLDEAAYVEEFVFNYGPWTRDLAHNLWLNRARSAQDPQYFRYAMLRRIAGTALAIVVHNPAAAAIVKQHAPHARIFEIAHLFRKPVLPPENETARLRARLGVPSAAVLFGVFGYLRESKRLSTILRAVERIRRGNKNIRLLVAGAFESADLERSIRPQLDRAEAVLTGYLSDRDFWAHACAVDVCVNLRHPSAGETSGIAIRLMGIGKPTVLTANEETARLPEPACVKVDAGPAEEPMLERVMSWLADSPQARLTIGREAAAHIAAEHDAHRCAEQYWNVLRLCAGL
jgi:glycosyltransferase involved in cell wall biosynthesis